MIRLLRRAVELGSALVILSAVGHMGASALAGVAVVILVAAGALCWVASGARRSRSAPDASARSLLNSRQLFRDDAHALADGLAFGSAGHRQTARGCARDLASQLASARSVAEGLPVAKNLAVPLASASTRASKLARSLSRGGAAPSAREVAQARALLRDMARASALTRRKRGLSRDPAGRALISCLASASTLAATLDSSLIRARATSQRDRAEQLRRRRAQREAQAQRKARASQEAGASAQEPRLRVIPLAGRLVSMAAWLLPSADRARFAEEYASELWDIAHSGGSRYRQLVYAWHQFSSSVKRRWTLLTDRSNRP